MMPSCGPAIVKKKKEEHILSVREIMVAVCMRDAWSYRTHALTWPRRMVKKKTCSWIQAVAGQVDKGLFLIEG